MGKDELDIQRTDEVVGHIVRRRVAKKVMRDIHHQVQSEKRNARYLLPLIFFWLH